MINKNIIANCIDEYMTTAYEKLFYSGLVITTRSQKVVELMNVTSTLVNPRSRMPFSTERKHSPIALAAETLWTLAGHNDVKSLTPVLPRAEEYAEDGVWRAGYGPRLFTKQYGQEGSMMTQWEFVVRELLTDINSRRAVMTIWDPAEEIPAVKTTKDMPCNNWLNFYVRNGSLGLNVALRSNDVVWGHLINQYLWSTLQEVTASILNVGQVAPLIMHQTSLHLYTSLASRACRVMNENNPGFVESGEVTIIQPGEDRLVVFEEVNKCIKILFDVYANDYTLSSADEEILERNGYIVALLGWFIPCMKKSALLSSLVESHRDDLPVCLVNQYDTRIISDD